MQSSSAAPTIYWVVGNGTDVGKTTVATALIRFLNANGQRAVGFKPFAASLLQNNIDFMIERFPSSQSKLFGQDAWKLTTASPLTGPDLVDLVVPAQVLCYPDWNSTVLMRTGSSHLKNVEYFCSKRGTELKDRSDLRYIIDKSGLAFDDAKVIDRLSIGYAARASSEKKIAAFNALLDIGVDAVVCEGAGPWLPIWQGCPTVNHLFGIEKGTVNLYPHLNADFTFRPTQALRDVSTLRHFLNKPDVRRFSTPLYLAESASHDDVAQEIIGHLTAKMPRKVYS